MLNRGRYIASSMVITRVPMKARITGSIKVVIVFNLTSISES